MVGPSLASPTSGHWSALREVRCRDFRLCRRCYPVLKALSGLTPAILTCPSPSGPQPSSQSQESQVFLLGISGPQGTRLTRSLCQETKVQRLWVSHVILTYTALSQAPLLNTLNEVTFTSHATISTRIMWWHLCIHSPVQPLTPSSFKMYSSPQKKPPILTKQLPLLGIPQAPRLMEGETEARRETCQWAEL